MNDSVSSTAGERRVLVVEPDVDGHHAFWLVLIILAFQRAGRRVSVLGSADDSRVRSQAASHGLVWESVDWGVAGANERGGRGLVAEAARRAEAIGAERVFFAFIDKLWDGLLDADAGVRRALEGRVEGIWFHPYALDAKWRWAPPLGKRWRLRGRLHRWLRTPEGARLLRGLYFLVDEAVASMARVNAGIPGRQLSDPWERAPRLTREEARRALGLPEGRTIFLHLGSAEPRKGLPDVLAAFVRLTRGADAGAERAPFLLRVGSNGRLGTAERATLDKLAAGGWARAVERFVPADELPEYFSACDWVLVPYRKFRYSSGILANAIGARRPIIASDFGYIGRTAREGRLGLVYPHGSEQALEAALREALATGAEASGISPEQLAARSPAAWQAGLVREPGG